MSTAIGVISSGIPIDTKNGANQGLAICAETVSEVSGIQTISAFASAVIACLGKALSDIPSSLTTFVQRLEDCSNMLSFFSFISYLQWWTNDETPQAEKSWQYTASMVCYTALQVIDIAQFLEEIKVLDLSKIAVVIGRIPVLDLVYQTLNFNGTVLNTWHDALTRNRLNAELESKEDALKKAKEKFNDCRDLCSQGAATIGFKARSKLLEDCINKEQQKAITQLFSDKAERRLIKYAKQSLGHRVRKLEVEVNNKKLEKSKNLVALVSDVTSIAYGILAIAGIFSSVGFLAVTAWPMLTLGLVSASIGLFEYIYDKKNPESVQPEKPSLVTLVDGLITHKAV